MFAFMTNGTADFLEKYKQKHSDKHILLMQGGGSTVAYYEGTEKKMFEAPRKFDVVLSTGALKENGFVVMNNIPVTDEGKPVFEDQFHNRASYIESEPGFQAFRLLRPTQGNTYIVMVQWDSEKNYEKWKQSDSFKKSHQMAGTQKTPAFFSGAPYVSTYNMIEER
ncbi:antibiotic biosynthesis monooxygenase [Radiobacillus kanasensis]|uniref:antibiotic biosynthesis monooxygenase family protein n=1 Tax=Radiobacillus kanasensis TaxID=2844358 RepID=UPI001E36D3C4|nr:antibiotic biosynthesis monooxygenase [Radiobacillus kanasensis]UFU00505.1 antibiotic biosynthesis monooxygenase [Radiobacillus kanasensis]